MGGACTVLPREGLTRSAPRTWLHAVPANLHTTRNNAVMAPRIGRWCVECSARADGWTEQTEMSPPLSLWELHHQLVHHTCLADIARAIRLSKHHPQFSATRGRGRVAVPSSGGPSGKKRRAESAGGGEAGGRSGAPAARISEVSGGAAGSAGS